MATRLMLAGGGVLVSSWPLREALDVVALACRNQADMLSPGFFVQVPLLVAEGDLERDAYVKPEAIEALEPVGVVVPTSPVYERAESRPCRVCGDPIEPGQAYVMHPRGPAHVRCSRRDSV